MVESTSGTGDRDEGRVREPVLDPAQVSYLHQRLASEQSLGAGIAAGAVASALGAATWAAVTVATGYQIGFLALGVGFLVGWAVRVAGRGIRPAFGVVGAAAALVGCAAGNLLAVTALVAAQEDVPLLSAVAQLDLQLSWQLMRAFFSPMDVLFYALALYEGYRLSFRQLDREELERMLSGGATAG